LVGMMANLSFLVMLMLFAGLREVPMFWTNAGGWPVWLRDLVGFGFYPMLFLEIALLTLLSFVGLRCLARLQEPAVGVAVILLPVAWLLLFSVMGLVAFNNVENLIAGRPLHWHAGIP